MKYNSLEDLEKNYKGDKRSKEYKDLKKSLVIEDGGLGDVVETITKATGIKTVVEKLTKDCGCDKRKEALNKLPIFKRKVVALRCMDENQLKQYQEYRDRRSLTSWTNDDIKLLTDLYAHVFARQYKPSDLCMNCQGTAQILLKITKHLDQVYESY